MKAEELSGLALLTKVGVLLVEVQVLLASLETYLENPPARWPGPCLVPRVPG